MKDMQTNSQQTEGAVAVRSGDLLCRDRDTLCRWWCELNCFEWPKDFPAPKPENYDNLADHEKMKDVNHLAAWRAINEAIPYPGALEYWNKIFLPRRHNDQAERSARSRKEKC